MARSEVSLVVGSGSSAVEWNKWTSLEVESDIRRPADAFNFRFPNQGGANRAVASPGDRVRVQVDGEVVLLGRVDSVSISDGPDGSLIEVTGRDLFGYLQDCSALPRQRNNVTLLRLARELSQPSWGITDWVGLDTDLIRRVKVEPGESVWEVLARIARKEEILLWLNPDGTAESGVPDYLTPPKYQIVRRTGGKVKVTNNVVSSTLQASIQDRYSSVKIFGVTDSLFGDSPKSRRLYAEATDQYIEDRQLVIVDSDCKTKAKAAKRAQREVQRRRFESSSAEYEVRGYYGHLSGNRTLWTPNTLVSVEDEINGLSGDYYLSRRRFIRDESGDRTQLELHEKGLWLA